VIENVYEILIHSLHLIASLYMCNEMYTMYSTSYAI